MDLQEKVHRAEMRMARTMFDSVEQGTDRITFPEYVDAHIRATEGNQAAPGQEASADEDDLVIGQNTPTDVKDSLFAGEFDPPGTTPSKQQGSNRSVGTGRGTSPDLSIRRAEKNRTENDANFYRTRVQRYTTPEKTDDYFGVDLPEPRTGKLTETEFKGAHASVSRGIRAHRDAGNDNAIRRNLGLTGFNAAAKLKITTAQGGAGTVLQERLDNNLKGAEAGYKAKSTLRQQIVGMVEADVVSQIFNRMIDRDPRLQGLADGSYMSSVQGQLATAMTRQGLDQDLMEQLKTDPEYKKAVALLKKQGKATTAANIASVLFWKSIMSTDDIAAVTKAANARVATGALVEGMEIPLGLKGKHVPLDMRNREHVDFILRDAIADEIESNSGLQEVARAVALGRFNTGNSLVASVKRTQRTFKSLLSQAMAAPNIQELYKTLLLEAGPEGEIETAAYRAFIRDVRETLVGNLEDESLAGTYDVLRSLGYTK